MTDKEIIKAIEICAKNSVTRHNGLTYQGMPLHFLFEEILGFVNRQNSNIEELKSKNSNLISDLSSSKAEIERLELLANAFASTVAQSVEREESIRAEAAKEFVEKLYEKVFLFTAQSDERYCEGASDAIAWYDTKVEETLKEFTEGEADD